VLLISPNLDVYQVLSLAEGSASAPPGGESKHLTLTSAVEVLSEKKMKMTLSPSQNLDVMLVKDDQNFETRRRYV
jgi:hypothetical protein